MPSSQYTERLAAIRSRFAAKLTTEIENTDSALSALSSDGTLGGEAVALAYRCFHNVCGVGPTIGFNAAGQAAQAINNILVGPFRAERALTADEMAKFMEGFATFRIAAEADSQSKNIAENQA